jgi:hypothetical protein
MNEAMKTSQQQKDTSAQNDLTARVGVKLTRPENSNTSPWSAVKRLFRIG